MLTDGVDAAPNGVKSDETPVAKKHKSARGPARLSAPPAAQAAHLDAFDARGDERGLEDLEVDRLLQQIYDSRPHAVTARCLAAASVESWVGVHSHVLLSHLNSSARAEDTQALPSSTSTVRAPAQVLVSSVQVHFSEAAEHWVLLLIHTRSKEVLLVDPLPPQADDCQQVEQALAIIRQQLEACCPAAALSDYSWRVCHLGVQLDEFNCGVWMAVVWREWLNLQSSATGGGHLPLAAIAPPFCSDIRIKNERERCSQMLYPQQKRTI